LQFAMAEALGIQMHAWSSAPMQLPDIDAMATGR
jgi:hypothetical protein